MNQPYMPDDGRVAWFIPSYLADDENVFGYHSKVTFHVYPVSPKVFRVDIFNAGYVWKQPILTELRECPSILECMRGCQDFANRYQPEKEKVK